MEERSSDNKQLLRSQFLQERKKLEKVTVKYLSSQIYDNFKEVFYKYKPQSVFTYVHHRNEVRTIEIIDFLLDLGITVFVPKINRCSKTISPIEIENINALQPGAYGILEPINIEKGTKTNNTQQIDIILTPGIVFDKNGGRIGYGGGYYDRFFKNVSDKSIKIGVAYSFQLKDIIPQEIHDIRLDIIITEKGIFTCNRKNTVG